MVSLNSFNMSKLTVDDRRMSIDHAERVVNYRYQLALFGNLFLACMQAGFAIVSNNLAG